jgi:hypothetical protein
LISLIPAGILLGFRQNVGCNELSAFGEIACGKNPVLGKRQVQRGLRVAEAVGNNFLPWAK